MWTPTKLREHLAARPALLLYFKNDHCAPCVALRPKVKELVERHFPRVEMLVIDTLAHPELAGEFQVFANPTLLVFFEGKEYIRKSKYVSLPELEKEIGRLYNLVFEQE